MGIIGKGVALPCLPGSWVLPCAARFGNVAALGLPWLEWRCLTLRPVMGVALRYLAPRPVMGVTPPRSAPVQGVSRPPHTASRDCRNGSPLARAIPCAPAPEYGETRKREKAGKTMLPSSDWQPAFFVCAPTRSAASRAGMAGWAGEGGGRFGERREYEAPTLPSTPRQHGSVRHHARQPRNSSPPHTPGNKQHTMPTRLGSPPHTSAEMHLTTTQASP